MGSVGVMGAVGVAMAVGVTVAVGVIVAVSVAVAAGVIVTVGVAIAVGVTLGVTSRTGRRVAATGVVVRALVTVSESAGVGGTKVVVAPGTRFCSEEVGFVKRTGLGSPMRKKSLNVPAPVKVNVPTTRATSITIP
jgi:hypothetical protein